MTMASCIACTHSAAGKPLLPRDLEAAKASIYTYGPWPCRSRSPYSVIVGGFQCLGRLVEERIIGRFVQQELRNSPGLRKASLPCILSFKNILTTIYEPLQLAKIRRNSHLMSPEISQILSIDVSLVPPMFDMMAGQPEGEGILCTTLPCHGNYDQLTAARGLEIS